MFPGVQSLPGLTYKPSQKSFTEMEEPYRKTNTSITLHQSGIYGGAVRKKAAACLDFA